MKPQNSKGTPIVIREKDCKLEGWTNAIPGEVQWRTLISADKTPTRSLTCGVAELLPDSKSDLKIHHHPPAELYYILEGTGEVEIEGQTCLVSKGDAVFIPQKAKHGLKNTGDSLLRLLYVFPVDSFNEVEYTFVDPVT